MAKLPFDIHWVCCWVAWHEGDCCVLEVSDDVVEVVVWLLELPPEHGLPSFTKTGTATLLGELDDWNKRNPFLKNMPTLIDLTADTYVIEI